MKPFTALLIYFLTSYCFAEEITVHAPSKLAELGKGYDTLSGETRGNCIVSSTSKPVEGQSLNIQIKQIENEKEFTQFFSISGQAKYALFSAGGSYLSSSTFNSYSAYMAITARIQQRTINLSNNATLTPNAKRLASKNLKRFRDVCGNTFIGSRTIGGEYSMIVEVLTTNDIQKTEAKASISASAGIFDGSVQAQQKLSQSLKGKTYKVHLVRTGGSGPVGANQDALISDALNFPEKLKNAKDRDLFGISVVALDYRTANGFPDNIPLSALSDQERLHKIGLHDLAIQPYRQKLADIEYVLAHPDQFVNPNLPQLENQRKMLAEALYGAAVELKQCFIASNTCGSFTTLSSDLLSSLPGRIPGPTRQELEATIQSLNGSISRSKEALKNVFDGRIKSHSCGQRYAGDGLRLDGCLQGVEFVVQHCNMYGCIP